MNSTPLERSFYNRDTVAVAKELLGMLLIRQIRNIQLIGEIVEVEAYLGTKDPAAHSFNGKTKRNEVLYGESGHTYVHNMHSYSLLDITTGTVNVPESILIRSLRPVKGIKVMRKHRNTDNAFNLCSGPGKLCQAFNIRLEQNGIDVTKFNSKITIAKQKNYPVNHTKIDSSSRVGVAKASNSQLRFCISDSPYLSRK